MATVAEEEVEYESDPEEAKLSLAMRRREASDDEDEEEEIEGSELMPRRIDSRVSDCESDAEGAAADYDDEDGESEVEEEEELDEELEEIEGEEQYEERETDVKVVGVGLEGDAGRSVAEFSVRNQVEEEKKKSDGGVYLQDVQLGDNAADGIGEEEKKENEPFAVPTAGAFYMHDDRFRDSSGGRHRRTLGARKLWESRDDRKWGHDKFEEMTTQERHYGEGRRASRGRRRGRNKSQGEERGYPRGNRPKSFDNNSQNSAPNSQKNAPSNQKISPDNQNNAPKGVRGRGPRRYQPSWKTYNDAPIQNKQLGKSMEKSSYATSARVSVSTSNVDSNAVPAKKLVFSSLNSASPPFYPSASSNKELSMTQKRDGQAIPLHRNMKSSVTEQSFSSNTMQGKNVSDFVGMNKLYISETGSPHSGKPLPNMQLQASGSSLISPQSPQSRVQGRVQSSTSQMSYQSNIPHNQVSRVSNPSQLHNGQHAPAQLRSQASVQASGQPFGRRIGNGIRSSSPTKPTLSTNSFEEVESSLQSSKLKTALVGKGKVSMQGSGRGSFPYGGAQSLGATGNLGSTHGDQNFPSPTFLPVMQFGGQHPGGMGVPAVGMAFPGYVGNPGLGNSEMTWLPVLAGAAGAMGATFGSPYLSVDGAYHARPSGQISSFAGASSRDNNMNKSGNDLKPSQRHELANDESAQRQNKARRYTEMKFDQ